MGNLPAGCGGETAHPYPAPLPAPEKCERVVMCRSGPYAEGFIRSDAIQKAPSGPTAVCVKDTEIDSGPRLEGPLPAKQSVKCGERMFVLDGSLSGGGAALRFGLGDRVLCATDGESEIFWRSGTVVGYWYYEAHWDKLTPYQVRLDSTDTKPTAYIYAPVDSDELIKWLGDDRVGGCGVMCGVDGASKEGQYKKGDAVRYKGGGRFEGMAPLMPDRWSLKVGAVGRVLEYHGPHRQRGLWPVDVAFSWSSGADGPGVGVDLVPVPLTLRDIELAAEEDCTFHLTEVKGDGGAIKEADGKAEQQQQKQEAAQDGTSGLTVPQAVPEEGGAS